MLSSCCQPTIATLANSSQCKQACEIDGHGGAKKHLRDSLPSLLISSKNKTDIVTFAFVLIMKRISDFDIIATF